MKNNILFILIILAVSSCSRAVIRHNLGVKADAPDEFMIEAKKKPLVIPENLSAALPVPQSEEKKKLNSYDPDETRKELYGDNVDSAKAEELGGLEAVIVQNAETDRAKTNIRKTIEQEYEDRSSIFGTSPGSIMESIVDPFGYNRKRAEVVDGKKENSRIRQALAKGEKVNPKKVAVEESD